MANNESTYYVIVESTIRYAKNLKSSEKLIYADITTLSKKYGHCTASNSYFAKLYDVHKNTVGRWINKLVKLGYLKTSYL